MWRRGDRSISDCFGVIGPNIARSTYWGQSARHGEADDCRYSDTYCAFRSRHDPCRLRIESSDAYTNTDSDTDSDSDTRPNSYADAGTSSKTRESTSSFSCAISGDWGKLRDFRS